MLQEAMQDSGEAQRKGKANLRLSLSMLQMREPCRRRHNEGKDVDANDVEAGDVDE